MMARGNLMAFYLCGLMVLGSATNCDETHPCTGVGEICEHLTRECGCNIAANYMDAGDTCLLIALDSEGVYEAEEPNKNPTPEPTLHPTQPPDNTFMVGASVDYSDDDDDKANLPINDPEPVEVIGYAGRTIDDGNDQQVESSTLLFCGVAVGALSLMGFLYYKGKREGSAPVYDEPTPPLTPTVI
jgi:hypothetical protein